MCKEMGLEKISKGLNISNDSNQNFFNQVVNIMHASTHKLTFKEKFNKCE